MDQHGEDHQLDESKGFERRGGVRRSLAGAHIVKI